MDEEERKDIRKNMQYCGYCQRKMIMPWELFRKHLDYCEGELVEKYEKQQKYKHRHDMD